MSWLNRTHSRVDELLNALPFIGFGRVDVSIRVYGNAVCAEELPWIPSPLTEGV